MIVRRNLRLSVILKSSWPHILACLILSSIPTLLYYSHIKIIYSLNVPVAVLGTTLAFFVGFRNNNAYDRWWEARRIWGEITNDSRSFAAQVMSLLHSKFSSPCETPLALKELHQELVYRQIGFAYALKAHLRKQPVETEAKAYFSEEDWKEVAWQQNIPNAILLQQSQRMGQIFWGNFTETLHHMQLDNKIGRFYDSMGKCERIKNTIFPRQYDYFAIITFYVFMILLPLSVAEHTRMLTIPICTMIGFIFYILQRVGQNIENPFDFTVNDIAMNAICKNIEMNLKQMLGDKENLPAPEPVVDGFLM